MSDIKRYLSEIKLHHVSDLDEELISVFGGEKAAFLFNKLNALFDEDEERVNKNTGNNPEILRQDALVDFINQDVRLMRAFASFYDRNILRRILKFILKNKEYIGNKVLDFGCGNGIITGYLSRLSPNSYVCGFDRSENALKSAKMIFEELELKNAYVTSKLTDITFDTIVSVRTFHENMILVSEKNMPKEEKIRKYTSSARKLAKTLSGYLSDGGYLISIERVIDEHHYTGMVNALRECGFSLVNSEGTLSADDIICIEGDLQGHLRPIVFGFKKMQAANYSYNK